MKHNKKRNTAFIYETLAQELTKSILEKDNARKNTVVGILKEFFTKGTILAQELELYNVLLQTENIQKHVAERLLTETKKAHAALMENNLFDTQSEVIAAINKNVGKDVWGNFLPNFKSLASVNAIFSDKLGVKKRVLFEQAVVDRMSSKKKDAESGMLQNIDNLTYGSFIKKFNHKYGDLIQEQKDLLNHYIVSFADDGLELRLYLNEEIGRLKEGLNTVVGSLEEGLIAEKAKDVEKYLNTIRMREFKESDVDKILKTQQLIRELQGQ